MLGHYLFNISNAHLTGDIWSYQNRWLNVSLNINDSIVAACLTLKRVGSRNPQKGWGGNIAHQLYIWYSGPLNGD